MTKPTPVRPLLLLLLWFPLVGIAQERPSLTFSMKQFDPPGHWQVGIKLETIPYQHEGSLLNPGLLVGYQLHSRLSLQVGATPSEPSKMHSIQPSSDWEKPTNAMLLDYRTGLYVPLQIRYVLTNPSQRFQLYSLAGIHTFVASLRQATYYKAGIGTEAQVGHWERKSHSGLGASLGVGGQLRLGKRFLLYTEATASQTWQVNASYFYEASSNSIQQQSKRMGSLGFGLGITYAFR